MKRLFVYILGLCLLVPLGLAQDDEKAPLDKNTCSMISRGPNQSPGQCCWSRDVETITADNRCLGVEFDENQKKHYWVTGADNFTIAFLYEIDRLGNLLNAYPQPVGNWGSWGWRDLAWDYQYLYAGDDSSMPSFITQISTLTGQPTGVFYGPYPVNPCRALAYETNNDCFWTASWGSNIYQCFKDGTYIAYKNPVLYVYGMAMDESDVNNPLLWLWSQDGNGCLATEYDPATGTPTGVTFDGCLEIDGVAGGACAYPTCNGEWEFVGMHQSTPDTKTAYCLHDPCPLMADKCAVFVNNGSTVIYTLNAGPFYAGAPYLLLGSMSGWYPGIPIAWTSCPMRINYDLFTNANIMLLGTPIFVNFMGTLDGLGMALAIFNLPPGSGLPVGNRLHFAYILGPGNDYVSNPVEIWIKN